MAKAIRSPETATKNWVDRASSASGFYKTRVDESAWKASAGSTEAEKNYNDAMTAVLSGKTRQNGVNASSDETWKAGVDNVGEARFNSGVKSSEPRMSAAMGKLIPAIKAARDALKARGVRNSDVNYDRSKAFGQALGKQRGSFRAKGVARKSA